MATLQRIRNHSVALLVIVGLAMAAFIVGDLLTSSSSIMQSSRDKVITIDGKKVTYEEFEKARTDMTELQKSLFGRNDASNELTQQINNLVYNEFISEELMSNVKDEIGFAVTDDEFNELTTGEHVSSVLKGIFTNPNTGVYMKEAVSFWANLVINDSFEETANQFRQSGQEMPAWATLSNWLVLENEIKLSRMVEKYNSVVAVAVTPNKLEAKDQFEGSNTDYTFAYAKEMAYTIKDSLVSINNSDVNKYYNAAKYQFKSEASRNVNYLAVALHPSKEDYAAVMSEMESVKEEFSTAEDIEDLVNSNSMIPYIDAYVNINSFDADTKEFINSNESNAVLSPELKDNTTYMMARILGKKTAPDSLKVSMIIVADKAKADSIDNVLKAANADFAATATASSDDSQSAAKGGDMGWMTELSAYRTLGKELANTIFSAQLGKVFRSEISNPNSKVYVFGKITEATAPVMKAKVAMYAMEVTPSSTTRRDEYGKLNNYLLSNSTIKTMTDSAAKAGYRVIPTTLLSNAYQIGNIADARQAVRYAFQHKVGEISEIFECDDNLVVVAITGANEAGYISPKDSLTYQRIERMLMPEAKAAYAANQLSSVSDKSLAGYAEAMKSKIDTAQFVNFNTSRIHGIGVEPKLNAAVANAEAGKVVGPIAGKNGAYVLTLVDKHVKNGTFDEKAEKQTLASSSIYAATRQPLNMLQKYAEIEDNRISFY